MRTFPMLILCVVAVISGGCGSGDRPVFGSPTALEIALAGEVAGPRLGTTADGGLVLSWMEPRDDGTALRFARVAGGALDDAVDVVVEPRMFVNWADLPSVMQMGGQHWVAHWLRYSADLTYSYDVVVSQSFDAGASWSAPVAPHADGTPTEHGFVSMYRSAGGAALLWLDGRDTGNERTDNPLDTSMTLRAAVISPDGAVRNQQLVDDSVCDCCQTDIAVASAGPVGAYRDRTAGEVRDIYVTRFMDNAWTPGERLHADNWVIPGCPVNGPAVAAQDNDVAVAWFSAANDTPVVRVARSADGGASFDAPVEVATGRLAGYVGLAALPDGSHAVSYVARSETGSNELRLRHITVDGAPGAAIVVATIEQLRVFPQLGYDDGALMLFWTDEDDGARRLFGSAVPVNIEPNRS